MAIEKIANGVVVSMTYVLTVDGEEVDRAGSDDQLEYLHGADNIVPGLEEALEGLWPQILFGGVLYAIAAELAPALILWSLPLTLGYVLAAPFAVFTSSPAFGAFLKKTSLCAIPEDLAPPPVLTTLESVAAANQTSSSKKD